MTTVTESPAVDAPVKRKTGRSQYVVIKNGALCRWATDDDLHFRGHGRLLMRTDLTTETSEAYATFPSADRAQAAIDRTTEVAKEIRGSVIHDWPKAKCITERGSWEVTTMHKLNRAKKKPAKKPRKKKTDETNT